MSTSETSTVQANTPVLADQQSKVPQLGEGFQESPSQSAPKSVEESDGETEGVEGVKSSKRRLFGFGKKKKDEDKSKSKKKADAMAIAELPIAQPKAQWAAAQVSPRSNHPYQLPSTSQRNLHSASPRMVSPAGSQIFERDVQESALPVPSSPAIPSHIQQENHIPAVLDASSEAITNKDIDPDSVEIVMHASHQPAAITVSGLGGIDTHTGASADDLVAHTDREDAASSYGNLDSTDVRRLSFISFQDIVQSEHLEHASGNRDSLYIAGLSSLSSPGPRSPSPVRSPVSLSSTGLGTSPPTSKTGSVKGVELSPRAKALGSPVLTHTSPTSGGELTIETMTQAVRRTESGDLSGFRSPLSPSSPDGLSDRSFK